MKNFILSIKKHFLILMSLAGIIFGIVFSFKTGGEKINPYNKLSDPSISEFNNKIAGLGIVEANSRNINLGSFLPGIISKINVKEGDYIKTGQVIFTLDQRSAMSEVRIKEKSLLVAESKLKYAEIELADKEDSLSRAKGLKSGHTISKEELQNRHFAFEKAKVDILIKKNNISKAKEELKSAEVILDKTMIKSPIDGIILKVRVNAGEYISGLEQEDNSPILLGNIEPLFIRVQIDESDIWRFEKNLKAHAYLRGNNDVKLPLSFIRIEPYAEAKRNIRGTSKELVDTRIVEIIYKIEERIEKLYVGQQLDVFIESNYSP